MEIRVQGYETQVKLFLVLLVLFLAAAGTISLNALYRTQALLLQEAEARVVASTRAVQRELADPDPLRGPEEPAGSALLGARLSDLARAYGIASLEILDRSGRVVAGTEPWRIGVIDPGAAEVARTGAGGLASGGAVLREPEAESDDTEYGPDRGQALVYVALPSGGAAAGVLLRAGHEVIGVRSIGRQIRRLAWMQAAAALVMLVLVLLFVRWVLRPYRALRAAAERIDPFGARAEPAPFDDPENLISSFTGVIEKLKDQETELERMRAVAGPNAASGVSQEMLDGLTSGVIIVGPDRRVSALNPAGEAILALSRDQAVGRDIREVFRSSSALLSILEDGVSRGRSHSREVVPYDPRGGGPAHLGVTVSTLPETAPGGGGAFCLFSDLTEIRGLQERVRLKENLVSLGQMSAGIAHEFRNALATILGYARLIGKDSSRDPGEDHAAAIAREVQSIGRVVDDFLRYARPASLQPSWWDPRAVMEEVAAEITRAGGRPGIRILVGGEWPPTIQADEPLLRQAFGNLLRNAVEAIPDEPGLVAVTGVLEQDGDLLKVEVADSGTGIPPEVLERLFTPFVTTKRSGTGLGLALAQKAIVSHDGTIAAHNRTDGGAAFVVRLPLAGIGSRSAERGRPEWGVS